MMKTRRFATMSNVEVRIGTTPAAIRDVLRDIVQCAEWNRDNAEETGSPQYADQAIIADVLARAAKEIDDRCKQNWMGR